MARAKNLEFVFAVVICAILTSSVHGVEFEEEFKKESRNSNEETEQGRGPVGGLGWNSGLFNFDEELFWPRTRSGQSGDKEIITGDDKSGREPLDVDFVSGPIGGSEGGSIEGTEIESPASNPFFPFGSNFGFGSFFPFNVGSPSDYKPWWKGDNVCVEREEDIEDWERPGSSFSGTFNVNFEACEDKPNKHVCTTVTNFQGKKRTVTESRMCCYGYAQSREKKGHCEKVNLQSVVATAEKLGANEFLRSAKNNGLEEQLSDNITLFVPLDGAFTDFSEQMFETNLVVLPLARSRRAATKDVSGITTKELALAHMVKGFNKIEEIENEQLLPTEFENSSIRINIFPTPSGDYNHRLQYTANCVPVTAYDKLASNGIVHTVQSVLVPVTQNLLELVEKRSDLVVFRTILEKTDLAEQLSNQDKTFTVFAPNDNAFTKLEPNIRRIVKEGNSCTLNILKNHILDLTFCGAAVVEKAKTNTYNLLGEKLVFERKAAEESNATESQDLAGTADIIINKLAKVLESDLMATNGVLYVIDTVLETASATPISVALESQNLTIFKRLVEEAGLEDTFNHLSNVSFFVPTDKAFEQSEWKSIIDENPESLKDNADLRKFLENHIGKFVKTCNLTEEMIPTKADGKLRVNLYSTHPIFSNVMNRATVNCARLIQFDMDSCGAVLHQVDKVLEDPKKSLLELLEETSKYSKFLSLLREANLTDLVADIEKEYTLLVPNDEVFAEQEEWFEELMKDKDQLEGIIKSHIVPDVLCCTAFVPSDWPFIRTIQTINGKSLRIDRNRRPMIGNAGITKCDVLATNGIVHEVNDVIVVKESRRTPLFF